jgi:hypothetical protein
MIYPHFHFEKTRVLSQFLFNRKKLEIHRKKQKLRLWHEVIEQVLLVIFINLTL